MKILRTLQILTILAIGSGCAGTPHVPLCAPDRPILDSIPVSYLVEAEPELVEIVARNDLTLKSHIKLLESYINVHNELYKEKCER